MISYFLIDSSAPTAATRVQEAARQILLTLEKSTVCEILENEFWPDPYLPQIKRIAIKVSSERPFEEIADEIRSRVAPTPDEWVVVVPHVEDLTPLGKDFDVSYYYAGAGDSMVAPFRSSAQIVHKATGLVARSSLHGTRERNLSEARALMSALLAGAASGMRLSPGNA